MPDIIELAARGSGRGNRFESSRCARLPQRVLLNGTTTTEVLPNACTRTPQSPQAAPSGQSPRPAVLTVKTTDLRGAVTHRNRLTLNLHRRAHVITKLHWGSRLTRAVAFPSTRHPMNFDRPDYEVSHSNSKERDDPPLPEVKRTSPRRLPTLERIRVFDIGPKIAAGMIRLVSSHFVHARFGSE